MSYILAPDMGELRDIIPVNIKKARLAAKLTQDGLGEKLEVSREFIAKLERKSNPQNITVETLDKLAVALGVSVFDLVKPKG